MSEIKNKIITISGEPVSGKSTVVKALTEKYEKMGYTVHVISTGQIFRDLAVKEYLKMYPDRTDANIADIQTDESFAKKRGEIDGMIDTEMEKRGKEINNQERPNDVYIIDSRLAWHNIPVSYAVRLTIDESIAGRRVFADKSRGSEDEYSTVQEATEKTKQRKLGEIVRYKQRYGVDLTNPDNYDLIVDTSYSNTEELAQIIIDGEEAYRTGEFYPKTWASPTHFATLQLGRETGSASCRGNTIESLAEVIKEKGYDPVLGIIQLVDKDGAKFVLEGNHRAMAALSAGKTLLPYEVISDKYALQMTQIIDEDKHLERIYDWAEGIEYYGGKIGQIEQLKNFKVTDLLCIGRIPIARRVLKLDEPSGEGR